MSFRVAGARDCAPCQKVSKTWGFCCISKNDGRRGAFEEDLRNTRDMFTRDVRRSGRWFPERGCILEHQIFSFGKMILCDRCTLYDPASLFRSGRHALETWTGKLANRVGPAVNFALNFPFLKEVTQNCFVLDVANFKTWGRLAELLRFWCCQLQELRKSRRIASFLTLSSSKVEEVSQTCVAFKHADRQINRRIDGRMDR